MTDNKKRVDKQVIANLASGDLEKMATAIDYIRENGNCLYVPEVIEVLHLAKTNEERKLLVEFLNDLKFQDSAQYIVDAILNERYLDELELLVSSCWQSRLNFSTFLPVFMDLVLKADYLVAFDAFSVVENAMMYLPPEQREVHVSKLKSGLVEADSEKKLLITELINVILQLPASMDEDSYLESN